MISTLAAPKSQNTTRYSSGRRIPPKLRRETVRRMSGRGWGDLDASTLADALSISLRSAERRLAGEQGPFAGWCEEAAMLVAAGIPITTHLTHLHAIAASRQPVEMAAATIRDRLRELMQPEQSRNAAFDQDQLRFLSSSDGVCLTSFRERAVGQAEISLEIAALLGELWIREGGAWG